MKKKHQFNLWGILVVLACGSTLWGQTTQGPPSNRAGGQNGSSQLLPRPSNPLPPRQNDQPQAPSNQDQNPPNEQPTPTQDEQEENDGVVTTENTSLEGLTLFTALNSTETLLIDEYGSTVHSWSSPYRPGLSVYLLEDGSILRTANINNDTFDAGGSGGRVEKYNWDGELIWSYDYSSDNYCLHHDIEPLPNGNVLMIAWEKKSQSEAIAAGRNPALLSEAELWPDTIIEVQPSGSSGGTIVWQWRVWDHLVQDHDATKANYGSISEHPEKIDLNFTNNRAAADWNHINSIDYHSDLDQIIVSVRNFSEIWIIDHSTTTSEAAGSSGGRRGKGGDLLYRWGNPQVYDRGNAGDQKLFVQHDAKWIEKGYPGDGDILIFNNGQGRSEGNYSSVDQITPPIDASGNYSLGSGSDYSPSATTWTYQSPSDFYAERISGAQRLFNGDTLICEGTEGRLFQATSSGDIVWEYNHGSEIFRAERYTTVGETSSDSSGGGTVVINPTPSTIGSYPIVDTGQLKFYNDSAEISAPSVGAAYYGQDAQFQGHQPSYSFGSTGLTVVDHVTGLEWTRNPDLDGDGDIDADDKLTYTQAVEYADSLNEVQYAGYSDWRLPSIKELYSIMNFAGEDLFGPNFNPDTAKPFVDTNYFAFGYGDTDAGERDIDAQFASTTINTGSVMQGQQAMFGLNLADGRIKGYPASRKTFYVYYVRGNTDYGKNRFQDNGDGTVSDLTTGLMWEQNDSAKPVTWKDALAWAQQKNAEHYLGYNDWRVPNAKELHSIVDYSRSPDATQSPAIDPVFNTTSILNEAYEDDYPWFWSSTTHASANTSAPGGAAVYICFGRSTGYMNNSWLDVHGAGAQRSDKKSEDFSSLTSLDNGYYNSRSPQGDASRIYNFVRLVR